MGVEQDGGLTRLCLTMGKNSGAANQAGGGVKLNYLGVESASARQLGNSLRAARQLALIERVSGDRRNTNKLFKFAAMGGKLRVNSGRKILKASHYSRLASSSHNR